MASQSFVEARTRPGADVDGDRVIRHQALDAHDRSSERRRPPTSRRSGRTFSSLTEGRERAAGWGWRPRGRDARFVEGPNSGPARPRLLRV
jgi:hypothetical protein